MYRDTSRALRPTSFVQLEQLMSTLSQTADNTSDIVAIMQLMVIVVVAAAAVVVVQVHLQARTPVFPSSPAPVSLPPRRSTQQHAQAILLIRSITRLLLLPHESQLHPPPPNGLTVLHLLPHPLFSLPLASLVASLQPYVYLHSPSLRHRQKKKGRFVAMDSHHVEVQEILSELTYKIIVSSCTLSSLDIGTHSLT